ncbi:aggregation-promoting factor C-terminal-like domain-containing protein [Blastococcus sp. SYSU DS0539]
MNLRPSSITRAVRSTPGRRPAAAVRRSALFLAVVAAGGLVVTVALPDEPAAHGKPQLASVSVAQQLGIPVDAPATEAVESAVETLAPLAASRSERAAEQTAAAEARAAAEQAELDRRAAEEAARIAAEEAARRAAEEAARAEAARVETARAAEAARAAEPRAAAPAPAPARSTAAPSAPAAPVAPAGSFRQYAMGKLGGSGSEFTCLENLWGKESGWNPTAQNPTSTAYGIAQFLNSTWAGTGIAKTSDGYRQIDAGLIYIENRYGSPCGAWAHFQAKNWY